MEELLTLSKRFTFLLLSKPKNVIELKKELEKITPMTNVDVIMDKVQQFKETSPLPIAHFEFGMWKEDKDRIRMDVYGWGQKDKIGFIDLVQVYDNINEVFNLALDTKNWEAVDKASYTDLNKKKLLEVLDDIIVQVIDREGAIMTGMQFLYNTVLKIDVEHTFDLKSTADGIVLTTYAEGKVAKCDLKLAVEKLV